jgi:hypothetical protein
MEKDCVVREVHAEAEETADDRNITIEVYWS